MNLLYAFIFAGIVCASAQVILDNSNLTPGHLTSLYTVLGAVLACFGIYDKIIDVAGSGATLMIINFGNALTNAVYEGYITGGILGIFQNMLSESSLVITGTIIIAFIITIFTKARD